MEPAADVLTSRDSPTDVREPSSAPEQVRYHHPELQPAGSSFNSALTSEACQSMQDAALAQTSANSQRQDSAISQQRIEASKDSQSFAPSSDFSFTSFHRGSDGSRRSSSPKPISNPTSPVSSHPLPAGPRSTQVAPQTGAQASRGGHATSPSAGKYRSMEPVKSHENEAGLSNSVPVEPGAKSTGPYSSPSDQSNNSTTRQQRYNVRFIANYTSENMPPTQKPRHDPSPVGPATSENSEPEPAAHEQPVTPSIEPSVQTATPSNQPAEEQLQAQQRRRDPSVERCQGCNEPWKRPLPNTDSYRQSSPAENSNDLGRMSMHLIAQLQAHQKKADAMYDRWKWKHSHCVPQDDYDASPPSPATTEPQDDEHSTGGDGALRDSKHPQTPSNKRKSEIPHDGDQKLRKVAFENQSAAAPPIRSSASA